jgi:DNA-binding response OmpR family regulator
LQADAKSVLIVDDERDIRTFLADLLTTQGFECWSADSGPDALRQVSLRRPDLVLLDIMMPGMGGIEVLRLIRAKHGDLPPVIMLSCLNHPNTTLRALDERADHFVVKPFRVSELLRTIGQVLNQHPAEVGVPAAKASS